VTAPRLGGPAGRGADRDGRAGRLLGASSRLLVAVDTNGRLLGRCASCRTKETPGLGDGIDRRKSDWIDAFVDASIGDPPSEGWRCAQGRRRVRPVHRRDRDPARRRPRRWHNALVYFDAHRDEIFAAAQARADSR